MKLNILFLLFVSLCTNSFSQNITVKGVIKDKNKAPVAYANVVFKVKNDPEAIFGTLADEKGTFTIDIPKQTYHFEVSIVGLPPTVLIVDLRTLKSGKNLGDIIVNTNTKLEEVVINSTTTDYKIELDKKTYLVSKDLSNTGGNLIDIMQNVPSVQVEVDGNISIRGNGNVRILIDGKPSGLTNTTALLQTIPAGSIDKIEVITNPSSKYSSEGAGGIVNVVLRKGKKKRLSSSFEVFSGFRLNSGTNININKGSEKYSWYINSGLGYSEPKATNKIHVQNFIIIPNFYFQDSERILKQFYVLNNVGGQLSINKKSTISTDITYRIANLNTSNTIDYQDFENNNLLANSQRIDDEENGNDFFQISSEYKLKLNEKGSQLKASLLTQSSKEDVNSSILENAIFPNPIILTNDNIINNTNDTRHSYAIDYIHTSKNNSQIEFGFRNQITQIKNNFLVERINNNTTSLIPEFTDQTTYKENVTAFYGQYVKSYKRLKFQFGLRTETTRVNILSNNNTETTSKNYTDVFPSSFINYQFNSSNSLKFSLSKRIQRPRGNTITPFNSFSDSRNIFAGNPKINPSYIVLAELGYKTRIDNKLRITPTLFYRKIKSIMLALVQNEEITFNNSPQQVLVTRIVNIGDNTSYGLEISSSYTPFNWFKIYNEINLINFNQTGAYNAIDYNSNGVFIYGRLNLSFTVSKSIKFQSQNRFATGRKRGQIESNGIYRMDIGLSKELFKNKASLTLNLKDVFDTWEWHIKKQGDDFTQNIAAQVRVPQFNMSFIYRLNQKKHIGKKGRQYDRLQ